MPTLAEKLATEILRRWIFKLNSAGDSSSSSSSAWSSAVATANQIVTERGTAGLHTEQELNAAVKTMLHKFPQLPRDTPRSELIAMVQSASVVATHSSSDARNALPSNSSNATTTPRPPPQQQRKPHPFDISPRECLSSRGASMFPPLQRLTPRSSSSHTNFRTTASDSLLETERRLAIKAPKAQPYFAHHFGKANQGSARRKRNEAAITEFRQAAFTEDELRAELTNANSQSRQRPRFTTEQIQTVQNQKYRYGLHFTAPQVLQQGGGAAAGDDGNNSDSRHQQKTKEQQRQEAAEQARLLLMTDDLLDKLRDREKQKQCRQALDHEREIRQRKLEEQRKEYESQVAKERQESARIEAEKLAAKEASVRRRQEQRKLADDLRRSQKLREERIQREQDDKEKYGAIAREENERAKEHDALEKAKARRRREAASIVNERLAQERRERLAEQRERERELERKELAARLL